MQFSLIQEMTAHLTTAFVCQESLIFSYWLTTARVADGISGLKANVTIHKQISDLLEESGMTGMTLNVSLCGLLGYINLCH